MWKNRHEEEAKHMRAKYQKRAYRKFPPMTRKVAPPAPAKVEKKRTDGKPPLMSDYHLNLWKDASDDWVFHGIVVRHLIADVTYWRERAKTSDCQI